MLHLWPRGSLVLQLPFGKLIRGDCCASSSPCNLGDHSLKGVPIIEIELNGKGVAALLDTGCSNTIVRSDLAKGFRGMTKVKNFHGETVVCQGSTPVEFNIKGARVKANVIGAEQLLDGVDVVLGMDVISQLGPIKIVEGQFEVPTVQSCAVASNQKLFDEIEDRDFSATFDGSAWTVKWKWKTNTAPILNNQKEMYSSGMNDKTRKFFEEEVDRWIKEGILIPWGGEVDSVLPLMAVVQPTKGKVRPVLDFRELNAHVQCHTGDEEINICNEKLREWRRTEGELELVDLQSAYLQIKVSEDLWRHQLVRFKGRTYCLTRLGFGLNVAPRIMAVILKRVLNSDEIVKSATNPYVDDILVNVSKLPSQEVIRHLHQFGLKSKPPEKLDGGAALGLKLEKRSDGLMLFSRGNNVPEVPEALTRRELFSICGKMVGHYPVAGWLRIACSYIKREANGSAWDEEVGERARDLLKEVRDKIKVEDPVQGAWSVPKEERATVWCDASSLGMGVILDIGGVVVEDRAWLRKQDDYNHINVAELDAVVKGVNLAIDWGVKEMRIMTDSSTVRSWVDLALSEEQPIRTKGAAEVLIKRRLGILKALVLELDLHLIMELVESKKNKADVLTRVPKQWLVGDKHVCSAGVVEQLHGKNHMGVDRTFFLAQKLDPGIKKSQVKSLVRQCEECQSVDPAPGRHQPGVLGVEKVWSRIAVDVTHYRGVPYLSIVDCGPGRYAIWRELKRETSQCICLQLQMIFRERGPVDEVLMDNAAAFHSSELRQLFEYWNVRGLYRAAHRASGNGIVERHHRTIKSWAEKSGTDPEEAVFWYNVSPRIAVKESSVPQMSVHTYQWRLPVEDPQVNCEENDCSFRVGDYVWVKPGNARCTTRWNKGRVTDINSANNVSVDGMPRHVLDVRQVIPVDEDRNDEDRSGSETEEEFFEVRQELSPAADGPVAKAPRALSCLQPFNRPGLSEETPLPERRRRCPLGQ